MSTPLDNESLQTQIEQSEQLSRSVDDVTRLQLAKVAETTAETRTPTFIEELIDATTAKGKRNARFLQPIAQRVDLAGVSSVSELYELLSAHSSKVLKEKDKVALLAYFEGLDYRTVAAQLESTPEAVQVRISVIKKQIVDTLKDLPMLSPVAPPLVVNDTVLTRVDSSPKPNRTSKVEELPDSRDFDESGPEDEVPGVHRLSDEADEVEQKLDSVSLTSDPVKDFLRKIGKHPLLNAAQEVSLATAMEVGVFARERIDESPNLTPAEVRELQYLERRGEKAFSTMVVSNQRLVVSLAKRYTGRGMEFLDLIQEGNEGLIRAAHKFDYQQGFKFSTYATWWIRQAITRALADKARLIRIPVHMVEDINKLGRVERSMLQDLGREPTDEELARELDTTPKKVQEWRDYRSREPISINMKIGDSEETEFGDLIADDSTPDPSEQLEKDSLTHQLARYIDALPEREREVVRCRFGLETGMPMTLDLIGERLGLTRERIRQIEGKAMAKLRANARFDDALREYLP